MTLPCLLLQVPTPSAATVPVWVAVVGAIGLAGAQFLTAFIASRTKKSEMAEALRREARGESATVAEANLKILEAAVVRYQKEFHDLRDDYNNSKVQYEKDKQEWNERWGDFQMLYSQLWNLTTELFHSLQRVVRRIREKVPDFDTSDVPDFAELAAMNPIKVFRRAPKGNNDPALQVTITPAKPA